MFVALTRAIFGYISFISLEDMIWPPATEVTWNDDGEVNSSTTKRQRLQDILLHVHERSEASSQESDRINEEMSKTEVALAILGLHSMPTDIATLHEAVSHALSTAGNDDNAALRITAAGIECRTAFYYSMPTVSTPQRNTTSSNVMVTPGLDATEPRLVPAPDGVALNVTVASRALTFAPNDDLSDIS
jgi:hypothetical protein